MPIERIRTLQPYIPGKSIEELANDLKSQNIIKLASNENPSGCSPKVREALANLSGTQIAAYPAPHHHPLHAKLAAFLEIDNHQLILANGSDVLFSLLLIIYTMGSDKIMLTHDKAFSTYVVQANTLNIPFKSTPLKPNWEVDIDAMIQACDTSVGVIFLANPNNPTGLLIAHSDIEKLLKNVPSSTIVVIDEAYYEYAFTCNQQSALPLLKKYENLVITRTFSKAYGLAGLRLGYGIAAPSIIDLLHRVQLPFTINQAAMAAGYAALDDNDFLLHTLSVNKAGMQQMQAGLNKLHCEMLPSECNFITFDCGRSAVSVYEKLLLQGIIVRPLQAYKMDNYLRVTIGNQQQNAYFLDKLANILNEGEHH